MVVIFDASLFLRFVLYYFQFSKISHLVILSDFLLKFSPFQVYFLVNPIIGNKCLKHHSIKAKTNILDLNYI